MANRKTSGSNYRYATVDAAPPTNGFATDVVAPRFDKIERFFFSIRPTTTTAPVAVVKLQFRCPGDAQWTNYLKNGTDDWPLGTRIMVNECAAGVLWRAVVYAAGYTSGSVTFGFDW